MKDLFGCANFIKFKYLEIILGNSSELSKLIDCNNYEKYSIDDYVSNMDSYLYGLIIFPMENISELKIWIKNYIIYLYIPLIERDKSYIYKSKLVSEIFKIKNDKSRCESKIKDFILNNIFKFLEGTLYNYEEEVIKLLDENIESDMFLDYLDNYYTIYKNKDYIRKIYFNNEKLRSELISKYDFLK